MSDRIPVQAFEFEATVTVKKIIHTDTPDIDHEDQLYLLSLALGNAGFTYDIRESNIEKP